MFDIHEIMDMELRGTPKKPIICNNGVDEVYNNRHKWSALYDNYNFNFDDGTVGTLKKFKLQQCYHSPEDVHVIEEEQSICIDTKEPHAIWLIIPFVVLEPKLTQHFDCRDCTNILKVAKVDFKKGQRIDSVDTYAQQYVFSFGERVYDTEKDKHAVVVGQSRCFAYIISEDSVTADLLKRKTIMPIRRKIGVLQSVPSRKALNYKTVRACALMEDYVVHKSEGAYIM